MIEILQEMDETLEKVSKDLRNEIAILLEELKLEIQPIEDEKEEDDEL